MEEGHKAEWNQFILILLSRSLVIIKEQRGLSYSTQSLNFILRLFPLISAISIALLFILLAILSLVNFCCHIAATL